MPNLSTTYLGLELQNPIVCSAGPLTKDERMFARMEDAGASAIVMHSLFEEQLTSVSEFMDSNLSRGIESFSEALSFFPDLGDYNLGPDGYLEHITRAKRTIDIPLIGSLNGDTRGGWVRFARQIEQAGADALELNVYNLPADPSESSTSVEQRLVDLVTEVRSQIRIPLAVKLGPFFSAPIAFGKQLAEAGADGLVLFNRFYQPDFNIETLEVVPTLRLSTPEELRLRLHWVALMYGHVPCDLAITGGVHSAEDILKSMMAGAKVAMMTSSLLHHGVGHIATLIEKINQWLIDHEYDSIRQMQGSLSFRSAPNPSAFQRVNYIETLRSYGQRKSAG